MFWDGVRSRAGGEKGWGKTLGRTKKGIRKTPSPFYPSYCVVTHPPTAPIESQQKTLLVGCFGMARDREPTVKRDGEKHPCAKKKKEKKRRPFCSSYCIAKHQKQHQSKAN